MSDNTSTASSPQTPNISATAAPRRKEDELDALLSRINNLTSQLDSGTAEAPSASPTPRALDMEEEPPPRLAGTANSVPPTPLPASAADEPLGHVNHFVPSEPKNVRELGLNESSIEELILKYLLNRSEDSGQGIADQIKIPFSLITDMIARMKYDRLLGYRGTTSMNDYVCELTDLGRERARRFAQDCTYYGAAPVPLARYCEAVAQQSLTCQNPGVEDLKRAFSDLLINPKMLTRLGAAVNSGRGMFLYGYPGNGKTSIAERITRCFGEHIWIPRAIVSDGEIIRVFDPTQHEEMPLVDSGDILQTIKVDRRWIRIRRPTIVVGGELTMNNLELAVNPHTGINEAPIQLKSNCGTLVIDDFGRQRMTTDELLNRWIVPLEKRYDYLNLPSGKKIQVPFDQLVVFSTNLEPKDLVDDAFLRRIPYKIEVENPSEKEFRALFKIMCPKMGFKYSDRAMDYLIQKHYKPLNRPFRCCHPRDILLQVANYCRFTKCGPELTPANLDFAVGNYFSIV